MAFDGSLEQKYFKQIDPVSFDPIFILGDHRSGTTLLYKSLVATGCFNYVSAYHVINYNRLLTLKAQGKEHHARQELAQLFKDCNLRDRGIDHVQPTPELPEEYGFVLDNAGQGFKLSQKSLPLLLELGKKIQVISTSEKPLLLKNPWDSSNFLFIKEKFPNCRIIFIHREATAVINSKLKAMQVLLAKRNAYTALLSEKYSGIFNHPLKQYFYRLYYSRLSGCGLRTIADETIESKLYFSKNIQSLSQTDYISITYEELCQNPRKTILDILQFLSLEQIEPLDFENLIKPRPHKLLPEVTRLKDKILQKLNHGSS